MDAYVDTSALAKWYLNENRSDEFVAWLRETAPAAISSLTVLEMRSLLARRRREGELNFRQEAKTFAVFEEDIAHGHLTRYPVENNHFPAAVRLIASQPDQPLRSLDALHLTLARELKAHELATADRVMARAAEAMGFAVVRFD
ncbi:MAG: type II toxin-antitoxin system VapC family toxin [Trueperaceae bacterium]